jgi:hypothetical protein
MFLVFNTLIGLGMGTKEWEEHDFYMDSKELYACESVFNKNFMIGRYTPFIDLNSECDEKQGLKNETRIWEENVQTMERGVHVLTKVPHAVNGKGMECSVLVTTLTCSETFLGMREYSTKTHYRTLTSQQCISMINTNDCHGNVMKCVDDTCYFDGEPTPEYRWMSTVDIIGFTCMTKPIKILAKDKNSLLFGSTSCKAKDLLCNLPSSIIVWDKDILINCAYHFITTIYSLKEVETNKLVDAQKNMAFIISGRIRDCEVGTYSTEFYKTQEGLFL